MRAEKRKAGTVGKRDVTVGEVIADHLAHPPAKWRSPVTVHVHPDMARHITAALGRARLAKLTPPRVGQFLAGMAAKGHSTSSIVCARSLLRAAIDRAERAGLAGRNVASLRDLQVPDGTERAARWFTMPGGRPADRREG
jgi:hypothetical protein